MMRYIADVVMPHPWYRTICLNGKPIGSITISPLDESNNCRAEIGYKLASKYWGKGIATKAVKNAAGAIFILWPDLVRLEAVVDVENPASQRVLEKAGFTKEGVLRKYYLLNGEPRDIVMFSLLSTDPRSDYSPDIRRGGKSSCEKLENYPQRIIFHGGFVQKEPLVTYFM